MDESFQHRAHRLLGPRVPARLDYSMLTATLTAQASASEAARAQAKAAPPAEPIGEILLGGSGWREAVSAQRGCFNRAEVKRRRKEP